jgi:hypothetical protein
MVSSRFSLRVRTACSVAVVGTLAGKMLMDGGHAVAQDCVSCCAFARLCAQKLVPVFSLRHGRTSLTTTSLVAQTADHTVPMGLHWCPSLFPTAHFFFQGHTSKRKKAGHNAPSSAGAATATSLEAGASLTCDITPPYAGCLVRYTLTAAADHRCNGTSSVRKLGNCPELITKMRDQSDFVGGLAASTFPSTAAASTMNACTRCRRAIGRECVQFMCCVCNMAKTPRWSTSPRRCIGKLAKEGEQHTDRICEECVVVRRQEKQKLAAAAALLPSPTPPTQATGGRRGPIARSEMGMSGPNQGDGMPRNAKACPNTRCTTAGCFDDPTVYHFEPKQILAFEAEVILEKLEDRPCRACVPSVGSSCAGTTQLDRFHEGYSCNGQLHYCCTACHAHTMIQPQSDLLRAADLDNFPAHVEPKLQSESGI